MQFWPLLVIAVAQTDSLEIRYIGNAGVELYDGSTTLLIDLPYESGAYDAMTYDSRSIRARGRVVSVITHVHEDHFSAPAFMPTDWQIIGPTQVTSAVPAARVLGGATQTVGAFTMARFTTSHAGVEHYSWLITWRGRRLYFTGDTEDPAHVLSMRDLDIVFITPWLTCSVREAQGALSAQRVVLYHQYPGNRLDVCGEPDVLAQGDAWSISPTLNREQDP